MTYGGVLLVVINSKPLKKLHILFVLYLVAMLIWSVSSLIIFTEVGNTLIWLRILVATSLVAAAGMFFFVQNYFSKRRWWTPLIFWYCFVGTIFCVSTKYAVQSAHLESGEIVYAFHPFFGLVAGPGYGLTIFSLVELYKGYRNSRSDVHRIRLRYLITAVALIVLVTAVNFTDLGRYPVDIAVNGIAAILIAYAILRHSLLDLRIVLRTGLVYSIVTGITGLIYFLIISLILVIFEKYVGGQILAISFVVALFSSLILAPLREKVQLWIDRFFYRAKYDASLMLQHLSETTATLMDLNEISEIILNAIIDTMKLEHASFYIFNEARQDYQLVTHHGKYRLIASDYKSDHPFVKWLSNERKILTKHHVSVNPIFKSLWHRERESLDTLEIELFIPLIAGGEMVGFYSIGSKRSGQPFTQDDQRILMTVANQTAIAVKNSSLFKDLQDTFIQTVVTLANAIDIRDSYTSDHSQRIARLAVETAKELGCNEDELQMIYWGSLLHDIGKIGIPDSILLKPGPLDPDEWEIIKTHPTIGANIIQPIKQLSNVTPIIQYSHEFFDGTGYPAGIKGDEIPLGARIVAVVDSFSAMIDQRVYKDSRSIRETKIELNKYAGIQFDPVVVDAFLKVLESERLNDVFETLPLNEVQYV
jgi:putative nucleotidyltransferase with HDIG domain